MSILFSCSRGHHLAVNPALAGQKVRCPVCLEVVAAPFLALPVEEPTSTQQQKDPVAQPVPPPATEVLPPPAVPVTETFQPIAGLEFPEEITIVPLSDEAASSQATPREKKAPPWPAVAAVDDHPAVALASPPAAQETAAASTAPQAVPPPEAIPVGPVLYALAKEQGTPVKQPPRRASWDEEDEEEEDQPRTEADPRREKRRQIRHVQLGLGFHYWKYLIFMFGLNLSLCGSIVQTFSPVVGLVLIGLGQATMCVSLVLGIVGSLLCTFVPAKTGTRPLIVASLTLDGLYLLLLPVALCTGMLGQGVQAPQMVAGCILILASLCWLAGFILFMLFLRKFATYLDDHRSAEAAMSQMLSLVAVLMGGSSIMAITVAVSFWLEPWLTVFALTVEYICMLVLFIKVLFGILEVIGTIRTRIN
jgi:hypothetical protein